MKWEDAHSVTSARVDLRIDDNATWMDAFQFGNPTDGDETGRSTDRVRDGCPLNRYDAVPLLSLTTDNSRIIIDDSVQRVIHFNVTPEDIQGV